MKVYIEYAFLENFLLDGLLLFLALRIARGRIRVWRLLLAAAFGAGEAVGFPLLALPVWGVWLIKILGGVLLCVIAVSGKRIRTYLGVTAAFFACTFALGGLLTAAYSFFGVEYEEGGGFLVERAPVALVFALAGIFAVAVAEGARRFYRFGKISRKLLPCVFAENGKTVRLTALADSGNLLEFRGRGVCVCSAAAIFAIFGRNAKEVGRIRINTASGGRDSPVFECEMRVGGGPPQPALLAVGEVRSKRYSLILHTDYAEANRETFIHTQNVAE